MKRKIEQQILTALSLLVSIFGSETSCLSSLALEGECRTCLHRHPYDASIDPYTQEMVDWLRTGGGFMSDKVEIRRRISGDTSSPSGLFVTEDVSPGELLFLIPKDLYLKIPDELVHTESSFDEYLELEGYEAWYANTCLLAYQLVKEARIFQKTPSESKFAPYIRYLNETQPPGQLPAAYSAQGKKLLQKIQDYGSRSPLPPQGLTDWIDRRLGKQLGCFDDNDAETRHAAALVIQRGFDTELIPVWDMINHDVRERVNVVTNDVGEEGGLRVRATKAIAAGDELLYSYNYCTGCGSHGVENGTPGIFRDFGFLEYYPQEWPFSEWGVYSTIILKEDGTYTAQFLQEWLDYGEGDNEDASFVVNGPDEYGIEHFEEHLSRLQQIDIDQELLHVSPLHEKEMIRSYYESAVIALEAILEQSNEKEDGPFEDAMDT